MDPGGPWPDLVARVEGGMFALCVVQNGAEGGDNGGRRPTAALGGGKLRPRPAVALTAVAGDSHRQPSCG
jgi:hypothetical protein